MQLDVLTLFPEMFSGYLSQSLLNLAIERGLVDVVLHNIRDWSRDKHQSVDDRPFGGGPGMVMMAPTVVECVEAVQAAGDKEGNSDPGPDDPGHDGPGHLVMLTPQGRRLDQRIVEELATHRRLVLLCGRYEGFDERIRTLLAPDEISVGDFVLNGGEVAAMTIIDSVIRLLPGVLGDEESSHTDSFSSGNRLLEHEQYTRPREYRGLGVPDVLLGGNHEEIARWRAQRSRQRTAERRNDLLDD